MPVIDLETHSDFVDWQPVARHLLLRDVHPEQISWYASPAQDLFATDDEFLSPQYLPDEDTRKTPLRISRRFIDLARFAASHNHPERFDVLYRLLWRITHGERGLLANSLDPQVKTANHLARQVSRDRHKMRAFVRFREVQLKDSQPPINAAPASHDNHLNDNRLFVAWFEPEHYILRLNADFFCRRFHTMDWSIVSPYQSLHWYNRQLHFGAGADPSQIPQEDALDDYWRCYYANIFNPARLKVQAMCREMPKKYWHNLPEASLIPELINGATERTQAMLEAPSNPQGRLPKETRFNREQWLSKKLQKPST